METIKSYTDINQSRKLAEILPLESADMYWWFSGKRYYIEAMDDGDFNEKEGHIRAWSLSALFSVLPHIDIEKEICSDDTYEYRVKAYIGDGYIGDWFDNPVDACYEMILKLKESNLL